MELESSLPSIVEPEIKPAPIIIDEGGDLILLVGLEAQTRIVVSSKVFSISSRVFKAMLSYSFREGREFAQRFVSYSTYILDIRNAHIFSVLPRASLTSYYYPKITPKLWLLSARSSTTSPGT